MQLAHGPLPLLFHPKPCWLDHLMSILVPKSPLVVTAILGTYELMQEFHALLDPAEPHLGGQCPRASWCCTSVCDFSWIDIRQPLCEYLGDPRHTQGVFAAFFLSAEVFMLNISPRGQSRKEKGDGEAVGGHFLILSPPCCLHTDSR